ncbi:19709_t:CDS:2, partial [Dentiscutata erythropus]
SNSPVLETRSTSAKSDNEASNIPTIKKTKLGQKDKSYNSQLKVSSSLMSNLISHFLNLYDITQNGPGLSGQNDNNNKVINNY